MTAGLVEGAALGALLQEGAKPVTGWLAKASKFKATRRNLESVVGRAIPRVQDLIRIDEGDQEAIRLLQDLQEAEQVVNKHSNVPWWKWCCLPRYQGELQEACEAVLRSITLLQLVIARDTRETLSLVKNPRGEQFKGLFKAPAAPDLTVGLDVPFKDLKRQLLQSGASYFVLTGLAGSGKTTLASLLCWDQQVRDKFGENILFVTVSKSPNMKTIVQTLLFQHYGYDVPDFGGECTVGHLKNLLKEIGRSPMMLVLDDVWDGSESLIDAFKLPRLPDDSDYKVLVTSRVDIPRFGYSCRLEPLCPEDSVNLFRHFALPDDGGSSTPMIDEELIQKVARSCWGSPLAIEVIGTSLCRQPIVVWKTMEMELSKGRSILDSDDDLLNRLQKCLDDVLKDKPIVKDCFMDLGLFPEDHKIPVAALIDMWMELNEDVNDDKGATYVHDLANRHLAKLVDRRNRKVAMDADMYYNNHFLVQHDLLRELAIRQSNQEPVEQRKRQIIDLSANNRHEWWLGQNPQGIISSVLSFFPLWWTEQKEKQVIARALSISTDETFTSDWSDMQPGETEVLVLNLHSSKCTLPEFIRKMSKPKVLIVTNYGFHPAELNKFELLAYLPNLKRIRLEKVSVPRLCKLRNVQILSLRMCNTKQVFESSTIKISDALPNLVEINIDYCKDLAKLPSDFSDITTMKKLSITNCHKLSALPQEIGKLQNLEVLRLSSCSGLEEMPESVGRLGKLRCLDISDCINLTQLPVDIGDLRSLQKLYMWGCSRLSKLPDSVTNFKYLQHKVYVTCDEEVADLWDHFTNLPNLKIETSKADISLNWLCWHQN